MTVKKVVLLSLVGLLVLVLIFSLVFLLISRNNGGREKVEYYEFKLEEMYTNIKESDSILKINITVEYTDSELIETLNKSKAKISNDVLELLRSKTLEELSGKEGQQSTRKDVQQKIIEIAESSDVSNIYFTEFIIQ
ncbi:MAG: flagellar basal body-associated FliL family protein [Clostridia bacterium]|nr:flagellar basal body-associated FliL family protein [Clostridia bacterium]